MYILRKAKQYDGKEVWWNDHDNGSGPIDSDKITLTEIGEPFEVKAEPMLESHAYQVLQRKARIKAEPMDANAITLISEPQKVGLFLYSALAQAFKLETNEGYKLKENTII